MLHAARCMLLAGSVAGSEVAIICELTFITLDPVRIRWTRLTMSRVSTELVAVKKVESDALRCI